jgi:hypothetical protein
MARRKKLVLGRGDQSWLRQALGFASAATTRATLREHGEEVELDFEAIERRCGRSIESVARAEIQEALSGMLLSLRGDLFRVEFEERTQIGGDPDVDTMPARDFDKLIARLEVQAALLRETIDELVQFDPELAFAPRNTREIDRNWLPKTSLLGEMLGVLEPTFSANEVDFFDYLTMRKLLDYFEHFTEKNAAFNNAYMARWTHETDHDTFDKLLRRCVVSLRRSGFPMGLAVPTDIAPEYESPAISVLLEIQEVWNVALSDVIATNGYQKRAYNYRQMRYLTAQILSDLESWEEVIARIVSKRTR